MIKKTALTLFQGEWVVFVKTEHEEHAEHKEHESKERHYDDLDHEEHNEHDEHEDHSAHEKHEAEEEGHHDEQGHDEHEDEEVPYKAKVVEILSYSGNYVAIKGLEVGEEYVSDGVYFVKSMLLKSSLGGHGH